MIMAILNVTPDSFSDGGKYHLLEDCIKKYEELTQQGANIIDIGAESSRPRAVPLTVEEEWTRLEPILKAIRQRSTSKVDLSIDTYKPEIMLRSREYGVKFINDITGTRSCSIETLRTLGDSKMRYIAMHMHGTPKTMQDTPLDRREVFATINQQFAAAGKKLMDAGFESKDIFFDPGIGFGKTVAANLTILQELHRWCKSLQVVIGLSRKSFIGQLLNIDTPEERDAPTKMAEMGAIFSGVKIVRTHRVKELVRIVDLLYP